MALVQVEYLVVLVFMSVMMCIVYSYKYKKSPLSSFAFFFPFCFFTLSQCTRYRYPPV